MALTKIKLNELTPKADPILADSIVISDSENSGKGALVEITDLQTLIGGGGGGGGAVDSVAGKTGVVTLDADDVSPTASKLWMSDTQASKLTGIAENANNYAHPASHPQSMIEGLGDALAAKAPLASPALTGTPTAPTAETGTNTTQIATTEFVQAAVAGVTGGADAVKLTGDQSIGGVKTFTSSPVLPTPTAGDDRTKAATTEFVQDAVAGVTASSIGLGSVDNTADSDKPVSTAQAAAIAACRPKHTYVTVNTNSTAIAAERGNTYGVNANSCTLTLPTAGISGGYVDGDEICVVVGVSALRELAITSPSYILRGTGLQPLNTPFNVSGLGTFITFTKSSNVWVMSYPEYELAGKAPLASPALTGTPTAPTAAAGTNTTQLATTAFVQAATASAIYDLPVTRRGLVSAGTDSIIFETANAIDPSWYDTTHVLNVSFFARNNSGLNNNTTFKLQLYDESTSTAHTIASITADTMDYRLLQASIYRASSSIVNCNIQYGYLSDFGSVSLAVGSYKLRVVCTSTESTVFGSAQVRFTK